MHDLSTLTNKILKIFIQTLSHLTVLLDAIYMILCDDNEFNPS